MGFLRFVLASVVVLQHVGAVPSIGHHAVFFFFVISGYLMTLVAQETYGYGMRGLSRFWANRALRLYPAYFLTLLVTVALIAVWGPPGSFRGSMSLPQDALHWAENLTMIYPSLFPIEVTPRLSPATWALTIELFYYAAISLGASRSRGLSWLWFALSVAYFVVTLHRSYSWHYYAIPAGSLPFASGALIYHYRDAIRSRCAGGAPLLLWGGVAAGLGLAAAHVGLGNDAVASALITLTTVPAVMVMVSLVSRPWSPVSHGLDKRLGDISYPLYVAHWTVAAFFAHLMGIAEPVLSLRSAELFLATFAGTVAFALFCNAYVDRPVEALRRAIRSDRALPRAPSDPVTE